MYAYYRKHIYRMEDRTQVTVDLVFLEVLDILKELGNNVLGVGSVLPNTEMFALNRH